MDMDGLETVRRYYDRAEEIRAIAAGMRDKGSKETLYRVAQTWESMAVQTLRPILRSKGATLSP